ncbi:MAG: hypothetical protein QM753_05245 [Thermomicrobiales bacterium]
MKVQGLAEDSAAFTASNATIARPASPTHDATERPGPFVVPATRSRWASLRRVLERTTPLQLAGIQWLAALVMVFVVLCTPTTSRKGLLSITETYGSLERVALWQRTFDWLPGMASNGEFLHLPPGLIVYSFRFGMIALFCLQALAFWQAWNGRHVSFLRWLIGPIGAHILMLAMVPSNADVFFYEMSGDLARQGINPYITHLYDQPTNPLYQYNHWVEMKTVYGPFWTDINLTIMRITGPDAVAATFAYKIVLGVTALALAGLVFWLVRRLTGNQAMAAAAGVLIAWQPNMIFDTSGQAHNDPIMLLLMTAGVALVLIGGVRSIRGALILVTASAAIKYVTLPVLGLIGLLRIVDRRKANGWPKILANWIVDGIAIVATLAIGFLPYWAGFGVLGEMLREPGRLFTNPLWIGQGKFLEWWLGSAGWYYEGVRTTLQLLMFAGIGLGIWKLVSPLWRGTAVGAATADADSSIRPPFWWTEAFLLAWAIVMASLSLVPANSHSWYWMWPVVPIATLVAFRGGNAIARGETPALGRWFWAYLLLTALMTLVYTTKVPHLTP